MKTNNKKANNNLQNKCKAKNRRAKGKFINNRMINSKYRSKGAKTCVNGCKNTINSLHHWVKCQSMSWLSNKTKELKYGQTTIRT